MSDKDSSIVRIMRVMRVMHNSNCTDIFSQQLGYDLIGTVCIYIILFSLSGIAQLHAPLKTCSNCALSAFTRALFMVSRAVMISGCFSSHSKKHFLAAVVIELEFKCFCTI